MILPLTLLGCGFEGAGVSANDLELKLPEGSDFLTIIILMTPRVF